MLTRSERPRPKQIESNEDHSALVKTFVSKIMAAWQKSVTTIIEIGQLLLQAKDELPRGEFVRMIETSTEIRFGRRTAERLMAIAQHPVLSNPTHVSHLPASWGTLYELTAIPPDDLERLIETKEITPALERKDVIRLGFYQYDRVPRAIDVLLSFRQRFPRPDEELLGRFSADQMWRWSGEDYMRQLEDLPAWISDLQNAWRKSQERIQERG